MKFLCDRARLEAALAPLLPAIPTKEAPKPALKSIHLRTADESLVLQASNLELSVETCLDQVKVEEPGACLVPARPFYSLVHEVPDQHVRVESASGSLVLPTSSGRFEVVTGNAADFPELDFSAGGSALELEVAMLARHLHATEFAAAREATRYAMNGILLSVKDGKLFSVATDGRRLALIASPLEVEAGPADGWQALLPQKALSATVKALEAFTHEEGAKVSLHIADGGVAFEVPQIRIWIQKITGAFPDYDAVIPRGCRNTVELNRVLLEANLRRVMVLTEETNPAVKISFEGSQATFESEAMGVGSAKTTMDVELSGPGGHIVFNPNFVADVLRVTQQDLLHFEFEDASSPGKFMVGEEFIYIVMPITGV